MTDDHGARRLDDIFAESVQVKQAALAQNRAAVLKAVDSITAAMRNGQKLLICGNGGSAADSQHIAAEFVGRFQKERAALPAIALTTDSSALTALGNDYGFDVIFKRQVEALGRAGDVILGISTSGNSANVVEAFLRARAMKISTIALTGEGGGRMAPLADILIAVPSKVTARIQEAHICLAHALCELVESAFTP